MKRRIPLRRAGSWAPLAGLIAALTVSCVRAARPIERPSATLCAPVDASHGRVAVVGRWHGRDVHVAIDTGGSGGSVSTGVAASLLARAGESARYAGASGKWVEASIYDVDGLRLGAATLAPFRVVDMAVLDKEGFDFQIGVDQLSPYVVDLALKDGLVCLRGDLPAGLPVASLSTLTLATKGLRDITVEATIAGKQVPAMTIDTGAGVSMINANLLSVVPHRRLNEAHVQSLDGSGVEKDEYLVEVATFCVLNVCEPRTQLMPGDDISALVGHPQMGLVGVPFLRKHRIILDFIDGKMGIDPT